MGPDAQGGIALCRCIYENQPPGPGVKHGIGNGPGFFGSGNGQVADVMNPVVDGVLQKL